MQEKVPFYLSLFSSPLLLLLGNVCSASYANKLSSQQLLTREAPRMGPIVEGEKAKQGSHQIRKYVLKRKFLRQNLQKKR